MGEGYSKITQNVPSPSKVGAVSVKRIPVCFNLHQDLSWVASHEPGFVILVELNVNMALARVISVAVSRFQLSEALSPGTIYDVPEQLLSQSKTAIFSCLIQLGRSAFLEY